MGQAKHEKPGLPAVLLQAVAEGQAWTQSGSRIPLHSNVALPEAERLYDTVRALRPSNSAEVGFAQGISAMAILQAILDNGAGEHHVMDPFQARFEDAGLAMVERAGLGARLRFYRKFSEEVIPGLPRLEFAFVDGSHLFDHTLADFVLLDKKLAVGGMIAFHDTWMESLQKAVRYILANRAYEIVPDPAHAMPGRAKKRYLPGLSRLIPGRERLFRPEILRPWREMGAANLVVLKKMGDDTRDWQFHAPF